MFRFALKVFPFPCYAITAGPTRNPARVIHCQSRLFVRSSTLTFASNWPVRFLSSPFFPFFSTTIDSRARLRGSNYARKRRGGSKGEERKKLKEGMAACTHFEKFTEISQTPRRKAQLLPSPSLARFFYFLTATREMVSESIIHGGGAKWRWRLCRLL